MAYDFNIDQILEMAEQIERNGVIFYRETAEAIDDQSIKDLLNELAGMEVDHEKIFHAMHETFHNFVFNTTINN